MPYILYLELIKSSKNKKKVSVSYGNGNRQSGANLDFKKSAMGHYWFLLLILNLSEFYIRASHNNLNKKIIFW